METPEENHLGEESSFLSHIEELERTLKETIRRGQELAEKHHALTQKLERAKEARDLAGKVRMENLSSSAALEARAYEQRLRMKQTQERIAAALEEERRLREILMLLGKNESINQDLVETTSRLNSIADEFDSHCENDNTETVSGPTRFDIDRSRNAIKLISQEIDQTRTALKNATENEARLARRVAEVRGQNVFH